MPYEIHSQYLTVMAPASTDQSHGTYETFAAASAVLEARIRVALRSGAVFVESRTADGAIIAGAAGRWQYWIADQNPGWSYATSGNFTLD